MAKTKKRKPAKRGKRGKAALVAGTAAVKRGPVTKPSETSALREIRLNLAAAKSIIEAQHVEAAEKRHQGCSGYMDLVHDEHENPPQERPAIRTIADVVRALGGVRAVKDWLHLAEAQSAIGLTTATSPAAPNCRSISRLWTSATPGSAPSCSAGGAGRTSGFPT